MQLVHHSFNRKHWIRVRDAGLETISALSLLGLLPEGEVGGESSVQAWCWQAVQRPEDRRRHTETKRERCSVCGQGSWCNWCNDCLSFLLRCHSLMTRPSSSGSLWQNTGTRSAGRRLSDSAAVADAFLPPCETFPLPLLPSRLPLLFVCLTFVCTPGLSSTLNYWCWPFYYEAACSFYLRSVTS